MEITQLKNQKEKIICKNEDSIRELWINIKYTNIQIIEILALTNVVQLFGYCLTK